MIKFTLNAQKVIFYTFIIDKLVKYHTYLALILLSAFSVPVYGEV